MTPVHEAQSRGPEGQARSLDMEVLATTSIPRRALTEVARAGTIDRTDHRDWFLVWREAARESTAREMPSPGRAGPGDGSDWSGGCGG